MEGFVLNIVQEQRHFVQYVLDHTILAVLSVSLTQKLDYSSSEQNRLLIFDFNYTLVWLLICLESSIFHETTSPPVIANRLSLFLSRWIWTNSCNAFLNRFLIVNTSSKRPTNATTLAEGTDPVTLRDFYDLNEIMTTGPLSSMSIIICFSCEYRSELLEKRHLNCTVFSLY